MSTLSGKMVHERQDTDLSEKITCVKSTLLCFNVVQWIFAAAIFGLAIWLSLEPEFKEWVRALSIDKYYVGIYIIIAAGVILMLVSFCGCGATLMESRFLLKIFIGLQVLCFILGLAGSAVLLDHSTHNSKIQPMIRQAMNQLIADSGYEHSASVLRMLQENVGCCGADGPNDYIYLRKPLPTECRDTVTGNAFFYGCVDELTWFLEGKSAWLAGITLFACLINVINVVLTTVFVQALKREEAG